MGQLLADKTSAAAAVIDGEDLEEDEAAMRVFGEMWGSVLGGAGDLEFTMTRDDMDAAVRAGHKAAEEDARLLEKNPGERLLDEDGEFRDGWDEDEHDIEPNPSLWDRLAPEMGFNWGDPL
jgi:hypothetical protein